MTNDEMVEKARAFIRNTEIDRHSDTWLLDYLASFARSAVRDALAEMDKFTTHGYDCSMHHAWNPANKHCDCGLSALRKKFGG